MDALRPLLLPENRSRAEYYLRMISPTVVSLLAGFNQFQYAEHLASKFQPYIDHEEARIKQNLQDIRYDFDASDSVHVVAGPGRIEKVGLNYTVQVDIVEPQLFILV